MELNKTYLVVGAVLVAMSVGTAVLVLKAPGRKGASAPSGDPVGLAKPRGLAWGKNGDLVIVDSKNNRLEIRGHDGKVKHVGKLGTSKGEFREPCDVAVDKDGNLFVADTFYTLDPNNGLPWGRVEKLDASGSFQAQFGKVDPPNADLFGPRGIAVDLQGRVWLSDTGHGRLLVYDNSGKFLKQVGDHGDKPLQFNEPFGLAVDKAGNVYVADRLNFRVQVVAPDFSFVRQFKVEGWDKEQVNREPYLAIDNAKGWLWVSDPILNKVYRYNLDGKQRKVYDKALDGATVTAMNLPTGLAVAPDSTVSITDGGSGRVLTLKP
jgi:DNA-binding beta-propeller fold protein YncE